MAVRSSACFFDCPDACGMWVESDEQGQLVSIKGQAEHAWSKGTLCSKTSLYGDVVRAKNRIQTPLIRDAAGGFQPATWDQALELIGSKLKALPGERILGLGYSGNMGVVARKFPERIINALGGTLTDGTICDSTAEAGYRTVLGRTIGFDLQEIESCDVIVLWGNDVARTMTHLMPRLKAAVRRGARVIALDIVRTATLDWVSKHGGLALRVHPGSDAALALALCDLAFQDRAADLKFLKDHCVGGAEFRAHVAGLVSMEQASEITGLQESAIRELADVIHGARKPMFKLGIGWGRRRFGGMALRAACSYAAVIGAAENVAWESGDHFDLDLGLATGEDLRPTEAPKGPISHIQVGRAMETGRFGATLVWCHNPAVTVPDSGAVRRGLAREDNFVVVHELFMTATAELADVILPATSFLEQFDLLRSYGQRVLNFVAPSIAVQGECRSNFEAFAAIGKAAGLPESAWAGSSEELCRNLLQVNRGRFTDDEWTRLQAHEPVELHGKDYDDWGTPSGKVELFSQAAKDAGLPAMAEYQPDDGGGHSGAFWLLPGPSKFTHNSTFLHSERHLARLGPPTVSMHPEDAEAEGCQGGEAVRIHNDLGSLTLKVALEDFVPRGALHISGFVDETQVPEGCNVNQLVNGDLNDMGEGSTQYSTRVSLTRLV
ncbi:MAG: molybdopterin-dependent oxidoreductase [Planctomycetota bacterium]|nr:molybdopterin-dependent oxidoreductase [Planctomycetota bacterium]